MTFGSLFSGIGGFDLGFERAGMECAWQCEIDRAARSVLRKQFPHAELHTDVSKLSRPTPVDVLCGGFPCQDLSVAGRRAGLAGARSGLWHEFRRLAGEIAPRIVVIENVPGLLSSNEGRDFAVLLQGLGELGYRFAWRVLDSQFDGVAQRRRRVFIVGSLGNGRCAEILFEPESLRWDFAPSRKAGEKPAPCLGCGPVSGGRKYGTDADTCESLVIAGTLDQSVRKHSGQNDDGRFLVPVWPAEVASTLNAHYGDKWGLEDQHALNGAALFVPASTGTMRSNGDAHSGFEHGEGLIPVGIDGGNIGFALRSSASHSGDKGDGGMNVTTVVQAFRTSPNCGAWETGQRTDALTTGTDPNATVLASTLRSNPRNNSDPAAEARMHVQTARGVRRLTPRECERLQGFPDDWTRWTDTGKEQADGPRYKQLGNAVTVTVAQWLGTRISLACKQRKS